MKIAISKLPEGDNIGRIKYTHARRESKRLAIDHLQSEMSSFWLKMDTASQR